MTGDEWVFHLLLSEELSVWDRPLVDVFTIWVTMKLFIFVSAFQSHIFKRGHLPTSNVLSTSFFFFFFFFFFYLLSPWSFRFSCVSCCPPVSGWDLIYCLCLLMNQESFLGDGTHLWGLTYNSSTDFHEWRLPIEALERGAFFEDWKIRHPLFEDTLSNLYGK